MENPLCGTRSGMRGEEDRGRCLITIALCKATVNKDGDLIIVKHIIGRVEM